MTGFDRDTDEVYCEAGGAQDGHPSGVFAHVAHLLTRQESAAIGRIPARVRFVNDSFFSQEGAEEILFGAATCWARAELPGGQAGLAPAREELLFRQYNYARYRLAQLRSGGGEALTRAREMAAWHERAEAAQTQIAQANLALVVSMAARVRYPAVDFSDLVAEGNLALLRSIDSFDVSRGFRFSTYAFRCVVKSFHRLAATARRQHRAGMIDLGAIGELAERGERGFARLRQEAIDSVRQALYAQESGLTDEERTVVIERFGLDGQGQRRSIGDVGTMLGLTHSRVRRVQKAALKKMRVLLADEIARAR